MFKEGVVGSYVYLIGSDVAQPLVAKENPIFMLSARYELPLFWLCLFKADDYSLVIDEAETEYENRYPFFSISKTLALKNATLREQYVLALLPGKWSKLWHEFIAFIQSSNCQYIHFNQIEHACMCDSFEEWREQNQQIIMGLDAEPIVYKRAFIFKRKYLTKAWYHALAAANITFPALNDITPWKLVGGDGEFMPSPKYLAMWDH
jgi:hypothetical protein